MNLELPDGCKYKISKAQLSILKKYKQCSLNNVHLYMKDMYTLATVI